MAEEPRPLDRAAAIVNMLDSEIDAITDADDLNWLDVDRLLDTLHAARDVIVELGAG